MISSTENCQAINFLGFGVVKDSYLYWLNIKYKRKYAQFNLRYSVDSVQKSTNKLTHCVQSVESPKSRNSPCVFKKGSFWDCKNRILCPCFDSPRKLNTSKKKENRQRLRIYSRLPLHSIAGSIIITSYVIIVSIDGASWGIDLYRWKRLLAF